MRLYAVANIFFARCELMFPASGDVNPLIKPARTDQGTDVPRSPQNRPREV